MLGMKITPDMILIGSTTTIGVIVMAKAFLMAKKAWPSRPIITKLEIPPDNDVKLPSSASLSDALDLVASRMSDVCR